MKNYFEINSAKNLELSKIPTRAGPKKKYEKGDTTALDRNRLSLSEFQTLLYANHSRSLLVIFQGMDTSGKDGAIKHVMSGVNPQGCSVKSFKTPTAKELAHDFLWRTTCALPERGMIGIFNRSYYESVLITRVHPELLNAEKLPTGRHEDAKFWNLRYKDISNYERYLTRQGYDIVKIFIHISKEEQQRRLLERFENPKKIWKISEGDIRERSFWAQYQNAYEKCIQHTSSKTSPWYIVPGDDKKTARLSISKILVERLKQMNLAFPKLSSEEELKIRKWKDELRT